MLYMLLCGRKADDSWAPVLASGRGIINGGGALVVPDAGPRPFVSGYGRTAGGVNLPLALDTDRTLFLV